jgi:hypothetical protein
MSTVPPEAGQGRAVSDRALAPDLAAIRARWAHEDRAVLLADLERLFWAAEAYVTVADSRMYLPGEFDTLAEVVREVRAGR